MIYVDKMTFLIHLFYMANIVIISDFRNNISDYINRIVYNKNSFLLKRGKSIVAKIFYYKETEEELIKYKIKKYAGILSDLDAKMMKKYIRK